MVLDGALWITTEMSHLRGLLTFEKGQKDGLQDIEGPKPEGEQRKHNR
jgi:hypothetical protein